MSKLLLDEQPLLVMPKLASKIGLNESIVLQQIHYWNTINEEAGNNFKDGHHWTYNSYANWRKQFPFWHKNTIARTIQNLESLKLVVAGNYNKLKIDRTKWYRIDCEALKILENSPLHHIGVINKQEWCDHLSKMRAPLPESNTDIKPENSEYIRLPSDDRLLNIYKKHFGNHFGKEHMRVKHEHLEWIEKALATLRSYDIEDEAFEEAVAEHFGSLPASNNGNIIAFLHAAARYFQVDVLYEIGTSS